MTALDVLQAEYQRYLEAERSLSASTVRHYLRYARWFLAGLAGRWIRPWRGCQPGQVTGFVLGRARRRGGAPQDMVVLPALRSLLRYLHVTGHTRLPLAGAVPAGRSWKPGLPRAASADDLRAVLAACDRESAGGRRDYAIVLAMTLTVIALWLGHEDPATTRIYLHADMALKEQAIARTAPPGTPAGRYQPPDRLLAFLSQL